MKDRLTANQALSIWQASHFRRELSPQLRERFLAKEELPRILSYPRFQAEDALRTHEKLADALLYLQTSTSPTKLTSAQKIAAATARRRQPTKSERALWNRLKNRKLDGYLFEQEVQILGWFVDFYCQEAKLAVEVDGSSHRTRRASDSRRDDVLQANGYRIFRVEAYDVMKDIETVVAKIRHQLPEAKSKKANRASKTSQTDSRGPSSKRGSKNQKNRKTTDVALTKQYSSGEKKEEALTGSTRAVTVHGPARCPGCERDFVGTYSSISGMGECRSCKNKIYERCRTCNQTIYTTTGSFCCSKCDPTARQIAIQAAGPGATGPTFLRQARRGKRVT